MRVLPSCMFVCRMHAWCLWRPEEGVQSSETRISHSCEPLYGCSESIQDPLQEQPVLLTTEPSRQPQPFDFNYNNSDLSQ